jgi:hypothetical protein
LLETLCGDRHTATLAVLTEDLIELQLSSICSHSDLFDSGQNSSFVSLNGGTTLFDETLNINISSLLEASGNEL